VASDILDSRYGRTPRDRSRQRRILWIAAAAFVVVFAAWVIWGGLDSARNGLQNRDIAFSLIDDHHVDVTFEVSAPAGSTSYCAVQALSEQQAVVGWRVVEIPPADTYTRQFTERVRTIDTPVTGLIYRCWLA
jgi:hypothetical protein